MKEICTHFTAYSYVPSKIKVGSDIVIDRRVFDLLKTFENDTRLRRFFFFASAIVTYIPSCKSSLDRDDSPMGVKFSMLPF